jgi:hypothetical protein
LPEKPGNGAHRAGWLALVVLERAPVPGIGQDRIERIQRFLFASLQRKHLGQVPIDIAATTGQVDVAIPEVLHLGRTQNSQGLAQGGFRFLQVLRIGMHRIGELVCLVAQALHLIVDLHGPIRRIARPCHPRH